MKNGPSIPGTVCREAGIPDGINQDFVREIRAEQQRKQLEANALNYERVTKLAAKAVADKEEMERVRDRARKSIAQNMPWPSAPEYNRRKKGK